jgi:hypothetical protein
MGFLIYAIFALVIIGFRMMFWLAGLTIKLIIFLVTLCFGRPTWARF